MCPAPRSASLRPRTLHPVDLTELFPQSAGGLAAHPDPVTGVTVDSRLVTAGDLYVALPGRHHHGAEFARQAAALGAAAVLTDERGGQLASDAGIPVVVVPDPRRGMAHAAAAIYGHPAARLSMLAVTGTNGKTTTTFLLESALRAAGVRTGLIGTIGFRLDGEPIDSVRTTVTTPEAPELHGLLGYLAEEGADAVLMEVSSHALVLGRADAITFDVAAFTNLGRDHLDFHGDEASYFEAKALLFAPERCRHAVVNVDDEGGRTLARRIADTGVALTTVSLDGPADAYATAFAVRADGRTHVRAHLMGRTVEFSLSLPGDFNIRNAITALVMAGLAGADLAEAAAGLAQAQVPGRMQRVDLGPGAPSVFVDFAHTPQAVTAALGAVSGSGRLIVVLGCGGDRDPDKRGPMGRAAAHGADVVLVTDDNPRSENPAAIRAQLLAGARAEADESGSGREIVDAGDRRTAIRAALKLAGPQDVIAILGKGHEEGQEVGGTVLPFSDPVAALEEWQLLRAQPDRSVS